MRVDKRDDREFRDQGRLELGREGRRLVRAWAEERPQANQAPGKGCVACDHV
jgi:hypothetical protein